MISAAKRSREAPRRAVKRALLVVIATSITVSALVLLFGSSGTPGKLLWSDTPASPVGRKLPCAGEKGAGLLNWMKTPWNVYCGVGSVSVIEDPTEGKAIRFFGPGGKYRNDGYLNQRAEQSPAIGVTANTERWLAFSLSLNRGVGVSKGWQSMFQLKNDLEGAPSLDVSVNERSEGLHLGHLDLATKRNAYVSLGRTPYGRWTRIVLGMHITRSGRTSWVEAWRDGIKVVPRRPWASFNDDKHTSGGLMYSNAKSGYFKFGVYRSPEKWNADWRIADLRYGTTRAVVR